MRHQHLIAWLAVVGLFVWVFGAALFGNGIWVFRDAGHYYYPLYQFTGEQLAAGSPALWNPYENLGMPLVANPTSALFYPPAWICALPIDHAWTYRLYVLGHMVLALGASYTLARRWNASPTASAAAALSYAFCGSVLYQVCNVVFLVGAAWMPLALLTADRMLRGRSYRAAAAFGAVMAAMTLGGDPQAAYHAGLLASFYALILWWREGRKSAEGEPQTGRFFLRPLLLAAAAGAAFLLASVQVLPSMQFTRYSSRRSSDVPRSLYELAIADRSSGELPAAGHWSDGLLFRRVDRAMHHGHVYHFSVGPWRLAEYAWPNVAGRQFPVHRRWADAIPSEGRLWVPSLYMGIVPLLLALAALRFRKADARTTWLSWSAVLCILGSFGWFGIGWLVREVLAGAGVDQNAVPMGPPVGGLYWLMTVLLPGYVYFRYPAKLLTLGAVALSMLTAVGWDRAMDGTCPRLRRVVLGVGWTSVGGALSAAGLWWFAPVVFRHVAPNVMFGPLDSYGAAADIFRAFVQTACLAFLFWWLLGKAGEGREWPRLAVLLLVAVDLGVANGWMVPTADADLWRQPTWLASQVDRGERDADDIAPVRVYRQPAWLPADWQTLASAGRLEEALTWDRATGSPKHNLSSAFAVSEVYGTMMPHDYQVYLWYIKRRGGGTVPADADLAASAVDHTILPLPAGAENGAGPVAGSGPASRSLGFVLSPVSDALPRAWFVREIDVLPPLDTDDWRTVWRRTAEVFHPGGARRDLRRVAVVEATKEELAAAEVDPTLERATDRVEPVCQIARYEPTQVELHITTSQPGLVVLADQFFPGWQVEVETAGHGGARRAPILRTNRVMRGVWVGKGEHRLVFRYRPTGVVCGATLSVASWLLLGVLGMISLNRVCFRRTCG